MAQAKKHLVIVESPAKAKTVASILGKEYEVKASIGHVRDLPKSRLGVDVEHGFLPQYIVPRDKSDVVGQIKKAAKNARSVFLATDPDREGEAISWHLLEAADLKKVPHQRVVFHEITRDAITDAVKHPRDIDMPLVDAYQARRVLDRLVGYKISPLLWNKVRRGLSAGRVQSVALRMVVDREREIEEFQKREYWTIEADLAQQREAAEPFRARLQGYAEKKRGELELASEEQTGALVERLRGAAYAVSDVRKRQQARRPAPPFTTSTLQQEASRRLGFTAKRTMTVAQQLYEGRSLGAEGEVGLITYMRTDSTAMADVAKTEIRDYIAQKYGKGFAPEKPRSYTKKQKGAQEAHEAIRPTSVWREPERIRRFLTADQQKLYQLIWQRAIASQMADALLDVTSVDIIATVTAPADGERFLFRATASQLRFAGFRAVYFERTEEGNDEDADTRALPELTAGELLNLLALLPEQHFTEPPARYTEATLVKALEENGIGRPSTYATILSTVMDRGYIEKVGRALKPTELGRDVSDLLASYFANVVDLKFTAQMEEELDEIAAGNRPWSPVVDEFYQPLRKSLAEAERAPALMKLTDEVCELCGRPMAVKWGRFGQFLACTGYPECKSSRPLAGQEEQQAVTDEKCPICESGMVVKMGRFGRFLACERYPECKGTKTFQKKIGVDCPEDGGPLVERRTKGRRTFYGCGNYPTCTFVSWTRPTGEKCPACGYLMASEGANAVKCLKCGHREQRRSDEAAQPLEVSA
ncbi:MAG TPA: type I DNA topoisomerase [Dehalococcoidia bacterium]|nr:type I DNA topoisomerase [Dehalococcoidia bacterium]